MPVFWMSDQEFAKLDAATQADIWKALAAYADANRQSLNDLRDSIQAAIDADSSMGNK